MAVRNIIFLIFAPFILLSTAWYRGILILFFSQSGHNTVILLLVIASRYSSEYCYFVARYIFILYLVFMSKYSLECCHFSARRVALCTFHSSDTCHILYFWHSKAWNVGISLIYLLLLRNTAIYLILINLLSSSERGQLMPHYFVTL